MPEQNPLPFPDGQGPDGSRPPEGGTPPPPTAGAAPDQATPPLPIPVSAPNGRPGKTPLWAQLMHKLIDPWVNLDIEPEAPGALIDSRPVCYVLEDYGLSNALILDRACQLAGLPSPLLPLPGDPIRRKRAYLALSRRNASTLIPEAGATKTHSDSLARLLQAHRHNLSLDVQLVPVSIFVGRAPDKASGWFAVLFSENWALVGRFRRLLAILLNGRSTIVRFSPPVSIRDSIDEALPPERTVRKLSRVLRTHFHRIRESVIGPDLSTRRLLVDQVLAPSRSRRPSPTRPAATTPGPRTPGRKPTPWPGKSPRTIPTRWCARPASC